MANTIEEKGKWSRDRGWRKAPLSRSEDGGREGTVKGSPEGKEWSHRS